MKKVIQINIGNMPFHIDEDAYKLINEYSESLKSYFAKEGDTGKEIIEDIEYRIAELLNAKISDKKQVISIEDINDVINTLGKIEEFDFEKESSASYADEPGYDRKMYRKLFRDPENSYLGGVSAGLSAYFNIDPLWVRLVFIALVLANGFGILLYVILWVLVPKAKSTTDRLLMRGEPVTIENIKKSVSNEYQNVKSSFVKFKNSDTFVQGKSTADSIFSTLAQIVMIFIKIILFFVGFVFILFGIILLAGLSTAIFIKFNWFQHERWANFNFPDVSDFFSDPASATIVLACILIVITIPIIALLVGGIKLLFNIHTNNKFIGVTALTAWILAFVILIVMIIAEGDKFSFCSQSSDTYDLKTVDSKTLVLKLNSDFQKDENATEYSIFDYEFHYNPSSNKLLVKPSLEIIEGDEDGIPQLTIKKSYHNISGKNRTAQLNTIEFNWSQNDSIICLDKYFSIYDKNIWNFSEVDITLKIPENQKIYIAGDVGQILDDEYYYTGEILQMTDGNLKEIEK